jgi:hypothetical protein
MAFDLEYEDHNPKCRGAKPLSHCSGSPRRRAGGMVAIHLFVKKWPHLIFEMLYGEVELPV